MRHVIPFLGWCLCCSISQAATGRSLLIRENEAPSIRTALGYSTLLQFETRPTSAVLGDQDAFRVEYVGNALSIKPLLASAQTNFFVFAGEESFTFKLTTVKNNADYLVRVKKAPRPLPPGVRPFEVSGSEPLPSSDLSSFVLNQTQRSKALVLSVSSLSVPKSRSAVIIHFEIGLAVASSQVKPLEAKQFSLTQGNKAVPIYNLFLYRSELGSETAPTRGVMVARVSQLDPTKPLTLGFSLASDQIQLTLDLARHLNPSRGGK